MYPGCRAVAARAEQENAESMTLRSDEPLALDPESIVVASPEPRPLKKTPWLRYAAIAVCVIVAAVWLGHWLLVDRYRITTDDAYVDTDQVMVMSRVSERVARVLVDTNQPVRRGQVLVELDDDLLRARVQEAEANLRGASSMHEQAASAVSLERETQSAQQLSQNGKIEAAKTAVVVMRARAADARASISLARAQVETARANVTVADAAIPAALANEQKTRADVDRARSLYQQGFVSISALESTRGTLAQSASTLAEKRALAAKARNEVTSAEAVLLQAKEGEHEANASAAAAIPQIGIAQGGLSEVSASSRIPSKQSAVTTMTAQTASLQAVATIARINLRAARIVSPVDGTVSLRNVQVGQSVAAGQSLLSIAPANKIFVTANYKETQVGSIHPGQRVEISVDGCRGAKLVGTVQGLGPVAQSSLSTLPTLTAPANFIKTTQRIPVRVTVPHATESCTLRPGMSVETSVVLR